MNLRPDELASQAEIGRAKSTDKLLKRGAGLATTAIGAGVASRIAPFLSEFIPLDLAIKGISKINPKIGEFLKKGQSQGLDLKDGIEFLRNQFSPKEEIKEESKPIDPLQDFETNHNDIAQALARIMQNGQSPDAAAAILKSSTAFSKKIKDLEKKMGKNFIDYILEIFGNRGQATQQQPMQQQMQPEMQQPQQQAPQQGSNVDAQLMAALDKILKM